MIKTIEEYNGEPCLIFDADLVAASGLLLGDVVDVEVRHDGSLTISPVAQPET